MITPATKQKVQRQLNNGIPEGELKEELRQQGYSEQDIAELFKPVPADMRSWFLIGFFAFAIWWMFQDDFRIALAATFLLSKYTEAQRHHLKSIQR